MLLMMFSSMIYSLFAVTMLTALVWVISFLLGSPIAIIPTLLISLGATVLINLVMGLFAHRQTMA